MRVNFQRKIGFPDEIAPFLDYNVEKERRNRRKEAMKKKINTSFFLIAALAILLTLSLATGVFYGRFREQVVSDLKTYAHVVSRLYE